MAIILKEKAIWFNDVILVPQPGRVASRKTIPREFNRFICSPMTSVVGKTFVKEATDLGLTVCIPRFLGIEKEAEIYESCNRKENLYCSMGLKDEHRMQAYHEIGCRNYLIDIASGYLPQLEETVKRLIEHSNVDNLILGNVTTRTGYDNLVKIFTKYNLKGIVRLGLSNGSGCQTYDTTGYGSGQLSEILDIYSDVRDFARIASDGGLKNAGYVSKAFLAGADYVFIGGMFAKALEAEAHISGDGTYYGLASDKNQVLSTGGKYRHSEGKTYKIDKSQLKPLKEIVEELWGGVSSAVSYSGFDRLHKAIGEGVFQIKQNSLPPRKRIDPID